MRTHTLDIEPLIPINCYAQLKRVGINKMKSVMAKLEIEPTRLPNRRAMLSIEQAHRIDEVLQ